MNITGAIFDLDGTVLDSMHYFKPMGLKIMHRYKLKNPKHEDFYALSLHEMGEVLKNKYGMADSVQEFVDYTNSLVESAFFNEIKPKPSVEIFLSNLKQNNVKMAIATLSDRYLVEAALKRCGLIDYFSAIFCCGEVGVGKKSPKVYQLAMEHLGTELCDTWVFEDSHYAAVTAKNAGFKLAGIADDSAKKYRREMKKISDVFIDDYSKAYNMITEL